VAAATHLAKDQYPYAVVLLEWALADDNAAVGVEARQRFWVAAAIRRRSRNSSIC